MNNIIEDLKDKVHKHSSYSLFKQSLIRDDLISLASEEVKTIGCKGLKEFYKSVRRGKFNEKI